MAPSQKARSDRASIARFRLETFLERSRPKLIEELAELSLAHAQDPHEHLAELRLLAISQGYGLRDLAAFS